jgi:tetratricopeptide (TPR) repeat protein
MAALVFSIHGTAMAAHSSCGKLIAGLFAVGLTACATPAPQPGPVPAMPVVEMPAQPEPYRPEDLPVMALSDEILIRILVGDLAVQNGEYPLALQAWMEVLEKTRDPRAARRAVEIAARSGRVDEALLAAKKWAELAPKSAVPRQIVVVLLIRANRIAETEPYLVTLLEDEPDKIGEAILELPKLWTEVKDRPAVLQIHEKIAARYPQLPEAHYTEAIALAWQPRVSDAIAALDRALKLRPDWDLALSYKAELLAPDDRLAFIAAQSKAWRESRAVLLMQAATQVEAGRLADAARSYDAVLLRWPDDMEAQAGAGVMARKNGDYARADRLFRAALARNPGKADQLRAELGFTAELRLQYREALDWYRQISPLAAMNVAPHIARMQAKLRMRDEALQTVAGLPETTPDEKKDKILARAQVLRELKDYQSAMKLLNGALAEQPQAYELLLERSLLADFMGDLGLMESDLRRYLVQYPDNASAMNALGYSLANRTDRLPEAESLIGAALKSDPDNPAYLDSLGWLRYRQGKLGEARDLLARAHALFPDPEVSAHYAEVLWQNSERSKARGILEAALRLSPDDEALLSLKKKLGL